MSILEANQLILGYNGTNVIDHLTLTTHPGELLGIIGSNGAGKTTILRALAGLLAPRSGMTLLNGQDVRSMAPALRARKIGLVPQGESYVWPLAVEEAVMLGRAPHRGWLLPLTPDDRAMIDQALEQTGLQHLRKRPVNKLSGGERQRVMIARALAQEPRILLLDEPTANLDIRHQVQTLTLIHKLAKERNLTAIVAIHDLTLAARFCDRLLLLHNGQSYAEGSPGEVLTPQNLKAVFDIDAELYRDPHGQWALSVYTPV